MSEDGGSGSSDASAEIEREMAAVRAEWAVRCREMRSVCSAPPADPEPGRRVDSKLEDIRITDRMLAVEKKYAPRYLNCRIRIRLLESRLIDASGQARDVLIRKLEQSRDELAAVDKACASEIELARLDTTPLIKKDEDAPSSKQDIGTVPDVNAGTDVYRDQKAGGGAD